MSNPATRIPYALLELAKHAPPVIPDWFGPTPQPKPERPSYPHPSQGANVFADDQQRELATTLWREWSERHDKWKSDWALRRTYQWPLVWAKGVLEAAHELGLIEPDDPDFEVADDYRERLAAMTNALGELSARIQNVSDAVTRDFVASEIKAILKHGLFLDAKGNEL